MMESFVTLIGMLFGVYIAVAGILVIAGKRRVGEIFWPLFVLLLAFSFVPGLLSSVIQSTIAMINPWLNIVIFVLLLIGIALKERASWKS